ncbi:MAG TPA: HNH endonuclease signature motif containing protein, partial [Gemmatimonadales bacterium]
PALPRDPLARFAGRTRWVGGCLEWTGALDRDGYAVISVTTAGKRRTHRAGRWIYEQKRGAIPPGLNILHSCDNRRCVNVDHLSPGTQAANLQDALARGRRRTVADPALIAEVRAARAAGESYEAMALRLRVPARTLSSIGSGERWGWVGESGSPTAGAEVDAWLGAIGPVLGRWDIDVAASAVCPVAAARRFAIAERRDGLVLASFVGAEARVFVRPAGGHGDVIGWVRAYRHARFAFLERLDAGAAWFRELEPLVELIAVPRDQPGPGGAPPLAVLYRRAEDATAELLRVSYAWHPQR